MSDRERPIPPAVTPAAAPAPGAAIPVPAKPKPVEIGGPKGPELTRYGDWEVGGCCTDF